MNKKLLRDCLRIAREKHSHHPEKEIGNFLHTSFVIFEGKIVSCGHNRSHAPAVHMGYASRLADSLHPPKTHSEISAWKKARGLMYGKSFQMVNIRLNDAGDPKISEPCAVCAGLLPILGCSGIYYTNGIDGWSKLIP